MKAVFVHLSDIHFGQEKDGGQVVVDADAKERLIDDAEAEFKKMGIAATGVILTGDIAYSAQPEQYEDAGRWLDRLTLKIGCSRYDIQMVPGNHDIDRESITPATKWHLDAIRDQGDKTLDMLLDDKASREALFTRFSAYRDFATGYGCELDCAGEYSADLAVRLAEGRTLRFVRFNSALICSRKDDEGKLILGRRQRTLPFTDGEEVVVLVHHPLHWFQDSDDAKRYISNRARVLISGHEHFPSLNVSTVEPGCDLLMLAAGATAPDEAAGKYTYKYNIIEFAWDQQSDGLAVTVHPRTWDDEHKRFMEDSPFLEGRSRRNVLASPNFRRAPLPLTVALPSDAAREKPTVEPIANPIAGGGQNVSTNAGERMLRLRFFRDLTEGQRLKILFALGAVPDDLREQLDHSMEQNLFKRIIKLGKSAELAAAIEAAASKRGNEDQA